MTRRFKRDALVHRHLEIGVTAKQDFAFQQAAAQVGEDLTCFVLTAVEDRIFALASDVAQGADLRGVFAALDGAEASALESAFQLRALRDALAGAPSGPVYPDEKDQTPPMNGDPNSPRLAA